MIEKLIQWVREVIRKMFKQQDIKDVLGVDVVMSSKMIEGIKRWSEEYEMGGSWVDNNRVFSLGLPAAISQKLTSTMLIEMKVDIQGSARAKWLKEQFDRMFIDLSQNLEQANAKGGMILKPYPHKNKLVVDFVHANQFFPISFNADGELSSCVFVDQRQEGKKYFTRLEIHELFENGVRIRNKAYMSETEQVLGNEVPLTMIPAWAEIEPASKIAPVERLMVGWYKFPTANNIDPASPLGISCFARVENLIKDADIQWSNILWEMESAQRTLFIDSLAMGVDKETKKPIQTISRLIRTLDMGGQEDNLFKEWSPEIRDSSQINVLNRILRQVEMGSGLSTGTFSDPESVEKTATEMMISRHQTYSTVVGCQAALERALRQTLDVMNYWADILGVPGGAFSATFEFDDSILVDKEQKFAQDLQLLGAQVISKLEFRMRNFKEDEATAQKMLDKQMEESQAQMSLENAFMNNEDGLL